MTASIERFALDSPQPGWNRVIQSPFTVAGWLISGGTNGSTDITVEINGQLRATAATGLRREDVAHAFPDVRAAMWSGFAVEVFADDLNGENVRIAIKAACNSKEILIDDFRARIRGLARLTSPRRREWRYEDVLACPACFAALRESEFTFQCQRCERTYEKRRGIPIFAAATGNHKSGVVLSHLLQTNPTNPNAEDHTRIIESHKLVLDLGAGNPRESEHYPNVVFHEFVHYLHTDVVSICDRLPYREGTFDAVISKATFEHVIRPWEMADELYRVLKPGGLVHVDTAFMYPLHGDPFHFFNMTLDGVKEIFKRFTMRRCGVKNYQNPSYGLRAQMNIIIDHLRSEAWRTRITEIRDSIIGEELDKALDEKGIESLAAGVFFEGTKPL